MNSKILNIIFAFIIISLSACGEKKSTAESSVAVTAETTSPIRYLGLRLLDIPGSADTAALEKEFTECVFDKSDIDVWPTSTRACKIKDLAPTYKERSDENVDIDSIVARCCGVIAATIRPNQHTYDKTLRIFDELPGVEKKPFACKNLETNSAQWQREIFIISYKGNDKFTIQEETDGGSGGNNTSTTIYFNMVAPNCNEIERLDKSLDDQAKKRSESGTEKKNNNNRNSLYDEKTGISLSKDSKDYNTGGCLALLAVRVEKGELKAEDNTEAGNAWIRSQGRRGADLMAKFKATPEGTSLFQTVKNRILTNGEAEFLAGYMTMREGALKSGMADRALASLSICGEAGYHKRF